MIAYYMSRQEAQASSFIANLIPLVDLTIDRSYVESIDNSPLLIHEAVSSWDSWSATTIEMTTIQRQS